MRKLSFILSALVANAIVVTSFGQIGTSQNVNYINSVVIGDQVWMTENLNVDKFRNGDPIPEAQTPEEWTNRGRNREPAWCYFDNNPANGEKYGKLYNWFAVNDPRGLAPSGWHVPSDEEWSQLTDQLGRYGVGIKMKSTSGWDKDGDGTNESGFLGMPGGYRFFHGVFSHIGTDGYWWSSTAKTNINDSSFSAHSVILTYKYSILTRDSNPLASGLSVRCIRD